MEKVTGIGGVFLRTPDRERLGSWYRDHLGFDIEDWGGAVFIWRNDARPDGSGTTTWGSFDEASDYFGDLSQQSMVNYRVTDLDKMLDQLRQAGVSIEDHVEDTEYGKFGWVTDCDGNRLELWQPPVGR